MVEPVDAAVIIGHSGASGKGWSELKDIECTRRYMYIKEKEAAHLARVSNAVRDGLPPIPRMTTAYDEAFQTGIFLHAARAYWLSQVSQQVDSNSLTDCNKAAKKDCEEQGFPLSELSFIEYSLMFMRYASYWAIRPKVQSYAVEYYLDHSFSQFDESKTMTRSTRLDDVSFYPDVGAHCIGEFKSTFDLSGSLKYYTAYNPQILMQWLLYFRAAHTGPDIKGTMIDIWDKGKNKGTRHFIPFSEKLMLQYEKWLVKMLYIRRQLLIGKLEPETNFMVCNTFNDAYKSQCAFKERCRQDE